MPPGDATFRDLDFSQRSPTGVPKGFDGQDRLAAQPCQRFLKTGSGPPWLIEVGPLITAVHPLCTVLPGAMITVLRCYYRSWPG